MLTPIFMYIYEITRGQVLIVLAYVLQALLFAPKESGEEKGHHGPQHQGRFGAQS